MIDADGYRSNVGIILCNGAGQLFWARRVGRSGWQFPQGGIRQDESPEQALFRELHEEVGLKRADVTMLASSQQWLRYNLPKRYQRRHSLPLCIGQKQRWFLLRLTGNENGVRFDNTDTPEFDRWTWIDYWRPVDEVIYFKRQVYEQALTEFAPLLFPDGPPSRPRRRVRAPQFRLHR